MSKETYYTVKRDLLYVLSKETYYSVKRDLRERVRMDQNSNDDAPPFQVLDFKPAGVGVE